MADNEKESSYREGRYRCCGGVSDDVELSPDVELRHGGVDARYPTPTRGRAETLAHPSWLVKDPSAAVAWHKTGCS